ncbi:MAG: DUF4404 family protein [Caldimonas sp.]
MTNAKHLDASISDLRSQIGAFETDDERIRHLRSLADDIEKKLGSSGNAEGVEAPVNLGERLTASILQFEGSHPRIAIVLNELAQKLSDMGI